MTTNGEWLDYLAQNAPDELAAWFDAEHVENQERALDGDTDALERKSADLIHEYYKPMVAELKAKVDELTAERDELQERLNRTTSAMNRAAGKWAKTDAELRNALDIMRIWISDDAHLGESAISYEFEKAEGLRKLESIKQAITVTIGGLEAERDNWKANCEDWKKHARAVENACYETMLEREEYRKLFGMALDWAHEITMLESSIDEGVA